jgi:hypothetical protein
MNYLPNSVNKSQDLLIIFTVFFFFVNEYQPKFTPESKLC